MLRDEGRWAASAFLEVSQDLSHTWHQAAFQSKAVTQRAQPVRHPLCVC